MKKLYTMAAMLSLAGCGYDDFSVHGGIDDLGVQPNARISTIRGLYHGTSASTVMVNADVVLGGWVTANDRSGNFYRSFVIQDETGAVEIKAALFEMHNSYPEGQYVIVRAAGMTVGEDNGVLQLGLGVYGNTSSPDYIYFPAIMRNYVMIDDDNSVQVPLSVGIGDLTESLCGMLVSITGIALETGQEYIWNEGNAYSSYNYRFFADADDAKVAVLVSSYADFANEAIPGGQVSVMGILMYGKANGRNSFIIKPRDRHDITPM